MSRDFLEDKFKSKKIADFECWEIMWSKIVDEPIELMYENDYGGSIPTSLDLLKIAELCKKKKDSPHMSPFAFTKYSKLEGMNALINVSFPTAADSKVIAKAGKQAIQLSESRIAVMPENIPEAINTFIDTFKTNQVIYAKVNDLKGTEDYKSCKDKRNKSWKYVHEAFRGLIGKFLYVGNKAKKEEGYQRIKHIRKYLYEYGFDVKTQDGIRHYVVYKRSASKAKEGDCLFIWDKLYDSMMKWTWLDKPFKEGDYCNLTSARAYEALVQSSIIGLVKIPKNGIVLLDKVEVPVVSGNRRILIMDEEKEGGCANGDILLVSEEEYKEKKGKKFVGTNVIWDGQALVDESVFKEAGLENKGMMLLRNSFFKACGFNTKIRQYYKNHGIEEVTDMFGNKISAEDVKMIVTVDSLKLLNFAEELYSVETDKRISDNKARKKKQIERAYKHWKRKVSDEYGIVKTEKASRLGHGKYHEISYQALNTLPLSEDDVRNLLKNDIAYMNMLKTNEAVLMHRLRYVNSSVKKKYFIYTMYKYCRDFEKTQQFKDFLNEEIRIYKKNLIEGHLKLEGDFYVLCSMPLEMLEYSIHQDEKQITPFLERDKAYIKGMKSGEQIVLFRFPHITSGSVCNLISKEVPEYDKWFNFENDEGSNIIVISPWESNIMIKLGGADFDSDTALLVKDETIKKAAKKLMKRDYFPFLASTQEDGYDGLPVAQADEGLQKKVNYYCNSKSGMAELDNKLRIEGKRIGKISNIAQLFNSYFWVNYNSEEKNEEFLKKIYDDIMLLAVLNELQIDAAKRDPGIDISEELKKLTSDTFNGEMIVRRNNKKTSIPNFLFQNYKDKDHKTIDKSGDVFWDCPVDYIGKILAETELDWVRRGTVKIEEIFEDLKRTMEKTGEKANYHQREVIADKITEAVEELLGLDKQRGNISDEKREEERERIRIECIDTIARLKINKATMVSLLRLAFNGQNNDGEYEHQKNISKIRIHYLGFLFAIGERMEEIGKENLTLACLKFNSTPRNILKYNPEKQENVEKLGSVELWGENYDIVSGKEE